MNYMCFCNTKFVFKVMRYDKQLIDPVLHRPVTVHINCAPAARPASHHSPSLTRTWLYVHCLRPHPTTDHPEKEARMESVSRFYHLGQLSALDRWNGGEGQRTGGCRGKVGVTKNTLPQLTAAELARHTLASNIVTADETWLWGGEGPVRFLSTGKLETPWGEGTWGTVPSPWRKDSLHVTLPERGGAYLLMFLSEKWSFVALRCEDERVSYGGLERQHIPDKRLVF
jgi:hypothetical protein